jgi:hypothetical protein
MPKSSYIVRSKLQQIIYVKLKEFVYNIILLCELLCQNVSLTYFLHLIIYLLQHL